MGLFKLEKGNIFVDEIAISEGLKNYQKLFGYVPQNIFLMAEGCTPSHKIFSYGQRMRPQPQNMFLVAIVCSSYHKIFSYGQRM